jgi:two-component system response regulator DevR
MKEFGEQSGDQPPAIRVFLIDDHEVVRAGLRLCMAGERDIDLIGSAKDGADAVAGVAHAQPDIILFNLKLEGCEALALIPELLDLAQRAKLIVLTRLRAAERHLGAYVAGARGIVLKSSTTETLFAAIRRVYAGALWFDAAVIDAARTRASESPVPRAEVAARIANLSERERALITLIGEGLCNKDIARRSSISWESPIAWSWSCLLIKTGWRDRPASERRRVPPGDRRPHRRRRDKCHTQNVTSGHPSHPGRHVGCLTGTCAVEGNHARGAAGREPAHRTGDHVTDSGKG